MKTLPFLAFAILIFGCAGPQGQAPPAPPPEAPATPPAPGAPSAQPPAPPPAEDARFASYENIGIRFEYPSGMSISEQVSGYPARANVLIQGKTVSEGAVAVGFVNMSGISSVLPDPLEQAAKILASGTESEDDIAGQAQSRGEISKSLSPNGIPLAERTFVLIKPGTSGNNVTMYGHALEFYDGQGKASYAVRIFSSNQSWSDEMKTRFVHSFRTGQ